MCEVSTCTCDAYPFVKFPPYELIQSSNISSTTGSNSASKRGRLYLPSSLGHLLSQFSSTSCCLTQLISKLALSLGIFDCEGIEEVEVEAEVEAEAAKHNSLTHKLLLQLQTSHTHTHTHTTHNDVQLHM